MAILELSGAERDEVDRESIAAQAFLDDGRPGPQSLALLPVALARQCRFSLPCLQGLDFGLVGVQNPIEEIHHLGWIEQRIEAVVGSQLQEAAELLGRGVAVALEQLGHPEHAVGLNDLPLRLQAYLGVEQGPQDLDGPAIFATVKRGLATPKLVGYR